MRYREATPLNVSEKTKNAFKQAAAENKGMLIFGGTGSGKTYVLHALANEKRLAVDNFVELLTQFRDYIQKGIYNQELKEYSNQEYLLIDDIGAEKTTDFVLEFLYLLTNSRYENMKRTVLTTNLSIKDFRERYGDRILSRISEMCLLFELEGEDRRLS